MITDMQKRTAEAIVNIFETGSAVGDYGNVTIVAGDPGHLTYGRSQTTLASGNLYLLLKDYIDAAGAALTEDLRPFLPRIQSKDLSLDNDRGLRDLLHRAGADPVMREIQDAFFDEVYWNPAAAAAARLGIASALGHATIYDGTVHGSFGLIRDLTIDRVGKIAFGVSERDWIINYIAIRREWLASHEIQLLHKTVYRMDALNQIAVVNNWDLALPFTVRGVLIDESVLGGHPARVSAHVVEERLLRVAAPMMQGNDVKALQEVLIAAGAQGLTVDGIFGPDTERAVRAVQQAKGLTADGIVGPATRSALGLTG